MEVDLPAHAAELPFDEEELGEALVGPDPNLDDSSEEGEDDEDEARKIQDGFIDDDEEEVDEAATRRATKRRKKSKSHHRTRELVLDEDDYDVVAENTGTNPRQTAPLTRLVRGRTRAVSRSPSPSLTGVPQARGEIDHVGDDDDSLPDNNDISNIFDGAARDGRGGPDDMDVDEDEGFIDDDDDEDGDMGEDEREARRREKQRDERQRKRAMGARPELAGIDPAAWDEIYDVFGDGEEYAWALDEDDALLEEDAPKSEMRYQDVSNVLIKRLPPFASMSYSATISSPP